MLSPINETASIHENEQSIRPSKSIESSAKQKVVDKISVVNQRSVFINQDEPLARCSVLYLGTAIPSEDERGIDSIQDPLSKRYPTDGTELVRGIEAWLSIDKNGLQIQFAKDPSVMIYYPIRSLAYCATIRFVTQSETGDKYPNGWRFIPLDSPEANRIANTQHPPLFAISFHRTRYLPTDECHCFVAKTKQIALTLVQACYKAYQATDSEQDCSKVPLYFKLNEDGSKIKETDSEIHIVPALDKEKTLDYQTNKKTSGFFYQTDQIQIDDWHLWDQQKQDIQQSSNSSHRQRRLASITSIPDIKPQSTSNSGEQVSQHLIDPFAPDPNVLRVERIKDTNSGRDIFIRWLRDPSEVSKQVPITQTPNYNVHVDYNADSHAEKKLSNDIQRLVLDEVLKKSVVFNDKPQSIPIYHEHKKSKKKHKHRHHQFTEDHHEKKHSHKTHRHRYTEFIHYPPPPPLIQQQFMIPPSGMTYPHPASLIQQEFTIPPSSMTYLPPAPLIQQEFTIPPSGITYHTFQLPSPPNTLRSPTPITFQLPAPPNSTAPFWFFTM